MINVIDRSLRRLFGRSKNKLLAGFEHIITSFLVNPFSAAAYTTGPGVLQKPFVALLVDDAEALTRACHRHRPGVALKNNLVQLQAWSGQFQ